MQPSFTRVVFRCDPVVVQSRPPNFSMYQVLGALVGLYQCYYNRRNIRHLFTAVSALVFVLQTWQTFTNFTSQLTISCLKKS